MRGWKNVFHASGNQKKAGIAMLISEKAGFNIKTVTTHKAGHYMMIKVSI